MKYFLCYSYVFLFLFACNSSVDAQSKIDSIKLEVIALNESYHKKLTALYEEMFELSRDTTNKEYFMARSQFHLFPIEENMNFLLDNINYMIYYDSDDFVESYPYLESFAKLIHENGESYPALMKKILIRLDQQQTDENLFFYSLLFHTYFFRNLMKSMNKKDVAACVRIMANSILYDSQPQRKQNLLKIADILEDQ